MSTITAVVLLAVLEVSRVTSGAVLVDDFEDGVIDPAKWALSLNDPGLQVEEAGGRFRIFGTTADTLGAGNPHVGILSQYTIHENPVDAVAIADMRVPDLTPPPVFQYIQYWVHLCNWSPDRNTTLCLRWENGRYEWWTRVRDASGIHYVPPPHAPFGDETTDFRTCQIEVLDGVSTTSVFNAGSWVTIGAPTPDPGLINKRLELKAVVYARSHPVDVEWDDARIFEHPASVPVLFAVGSDTRSVALLHEGAVVDSAGAVGGTVALHLDLRAPIPYDLQLRLYEDDVLLGGAGLPADGVDGVYPGDAYEVTFTPPVSAEASVTTTSWGSVKGRYR